MVETSIPLKSQIVAFTNDKSEKSRQALLNMELNEGATAKNMLLHEVARNNADAQVRQSARQFRAAIKEINKKIPVGEGVSLEILQAVGLLLNDG